MFPLYMSQYANYWFRLTTLLSTSIRINTKSMRTILLLLWAIPSALFASISIFFIGANKVNITVSGSNIENYLSAITVVLSAITFSVGYGCFRQYKSTLYAALFYLFCAAYVLASSVFQTDIVHLKNLILPSYFILVSLGTIIFFKTKQEDESV